MSKRSYYFSHDFNSRNDRKIIDLRMRYGMEGLGIYWCLIEALHEEDGILELKDIARLAFDLRVPYESIESIIKDTDLFESCVQVIYATERHFKVY